MEKNKMERSDEGSKLQGSRSWRELGGAFGESSKNFIHLRRLQDLMEFYYSLYVFYFI